MINGTALAATSHVHTDFFCTFPHPFNAIPASHATCIHATALESPALVLMLAFTLLGPCAGGSACAAPPGGAQDAVAGGAHHHTGAAAASAGGAGGRGGGHAGAGPGRGSGPHARHCWLVSVVNLGCWGHGRELTRSSFQEGLVRAVLRKLEQRGMT